MIPLEKYPHIPQWFSLREAIAELEKATIEIRGRMSLPRALLVYDENYQVSGIVRRRDILRGLEPKFLRKGTTTHGRSPFEVEIDPNLLDFSLESSLGTIRDNAAKEIKTVMEPIEVTVGADDNLAKVIYTMISHDMHLIPVMHDGKAIGVLRSVDVFDEIADLLL